MTLGMILTIIIAASAVIGGLAGLIKTVFVETPRDWEIEKQYRDEKPKATPKPRKRSYEIHYKECRKK